MKPFLLLCLLSVVTAQYFSLRVPDGRAICLGNGGTHAYLKLAAYNPNDQTQQWYFETASAGVYFVVSRAYHALNFDISGNNVNANTRITGWERSPTPANQKFKYSGGFLTPNSNANLFVGASGDVVQLIQKTANSVGLTFVNATDPTQPPTQPPPTQPPPTQPPPTQPPPTQPPPTQPPPTEPPTPAPTQAPPVGSCQEALVNPVDGKKWNLKAISISDLYDSGWWDYAVNFCGVDECDNNGRNLGCQSGFRGLGTVNEATFEFAVGKLTISATGGYVDWGCGNPRSSTYILTCKTDDSSDIVASVTGGCHYTFTIAVPKIYCS